MELALKLFQAPTCLALLVAPRMLVLLDSLRCQLNSTLVHSITTTPSPHLSALLCHPTPIPSRVSCRTARSGRCGVGGCDGAAGPHSGKASKDGQCPSCLPPHRSDFLEVHGALTKFCARTKCCALAYPYLPIPSPHQARALLRPSTCSIQFKSRLNVE